MEKEFVAYEQAIALKKLGFESPYPIGGYQGGKIFYYEKGELYYDAQPMYSSNYHDGQLLAPLYQQAFRWFREKYELHSTITSISQESWQWHITKTGESLGKLYDEDFYTYEEAELECLKKLIEIVKQQK